MPAWKDSAAQGLVAVEVPWSEWEDSVAAQDSRFAPTVPGELVELSSPTSELPTDPVPLDSLFDNLSLTPMLSPVEMDEAAKVMYKLGKK